MKKNVEKETSNKTTTNKLTSKRIGVAKEEMKGFGLSLEDLNSIPVDEFFDD